MLSFVDCRFWDWIKTNEWPTSILLETVRFQQVQFLAEHLNQNVSFPTLTTPMGFVMTWLASLSRTSLQPTLLADDHTCAHFPDLSTFWRVRLSQLSTHELSSYVFEFVKKDFFTCTYFKLHSALTCKKGCPIKWHLSIPFILPKNIYLGLMMYVLFDFLTTAT